MLASHQSPLLLLLLLKVDLSETIWEVVVETVVMDVEKTSVDACLSTRRVEFFNQPHRTGLLRVPFHVDLIGLRHKKN